MEIIDNGVVLARLVRKTDLIEPGLSFFSFAEEGIQVAFWNHNKETILAPHIHNVFDRVNNRTSEVLVVISGKVHFDIYNDNEEMILEGELVSGDILISLAGGHGYKIIEENTQVIEVKNGPYSGPEIDRRRINSLCQVASL